MFCYNILLLEVQFFDGDNEQILSKFKHFVSIKKIKINNVLASIIKFKKKLDVETKKTLKIFIHFISLDSQSTIFFKTRNSYVITIDH